GALALADAVLAEIDMRAHRGIHPRLGALDVVPFVPLAGVTMAEAVTLARQVGHELAKRHALPVYYYGQAARGPGRRTLRELRHGEYEGLAERLATPDGAPDDGPARFDPRAGAAREQRRAAGGAGARPAAGQSRPRPGLDECARLPRDAAAGRLRSRERRGRAPRGRDRARRAGRPGPARGVRRPRAGRRRPRSLPPRSLPRRLGVGRT